MHLPTTVWSTLLKVRRDPARVKDLVVRRYRQPVYEFALQRGLPPEDADDVAQEVFLRVCREEFLEKADRTRGRFRTLLLAVRTRENATAAGASRWKTSTSPTSRPRKTPSSTGFGPGTSSRRPSIGSRKMRRSPRTA
jgi:sigma-70-like protein